MEHMLPWIFAKGATDSIEVHLGVGAVVRCLGALPQRRALAF